MKPQILYHAYINATGYSIAAQDYILAMKHVDPALQIKLRYVNAAIKIGVSPNRQQLFAAMQKLKDEEHQVSVYHTIPHLYKRVPTAQKHVGVCLFETINPPKSWVNMMNQMDAIITASDFNKNIFATNGVAKPINVVPHAFDPRLFHKDVQAIGRYRQFTFLAMGTWKTRKNWDVLIKAFYDGFERKDNVCLLIKTDKPKELAAEVVRIKRTGSWRSKETGPIYTEEKTNCSFEDIPAFMKKGDVYICASLGEGFGLPGLHAMALGIPVITTKFGGALQYAKPETCTYIEPKSYKTYPTMDRIPQFANCIWPVIQMEDVRDVMRQVYENIPRDKVAFAYDYVQKNFNYDVIGRRFIEALTHD